VDDITFNDFKITLTTIQAMMHGWFIARVHAANQVTSGYGYVSALWVIKHQELVKRLARYTSLNELKINTILSYLKFANHDIRHPDIAIQPLIELSDKQLLLSPFLWININAERNFCTLLNKIPAARETYLKLTLEKESVLYEELKDVLERLGYEIAHGRLTSTDLDIAIIDRKNKVCACIELKWFIEPAEIREVIERSIELTKGVKQSKIIKTLLDSGDKKLVHEILKIDNTYRTSTFVGSRNWIGHSDLQRLDVPIIKIWHFVKELMTQGRLDKTLDWVESRSYLPANGKDYWIVPVDIETGSWKSKWYGIASWPPALQLELAQSSNEVEI
jgi:signal transduction histidine kinase